MALLDKGMKRRDFLKASAATAADVYKRQAVRPVATAMKQSPKATMDLPEPVGVPRITESPTAKSMSASS